MWKWVSPLNKSKKHFQRVSRKQEQKQHLDKMLNGDLQGTLERKAQYYKKLGLERQAKKIRNFKKQVREMVGSL